MFYVSIIFQKNLQVYPYSSILITIFAIMQSMSDFKHIDTFYQTKQLRLGIFLKRLKLLSTSQYYAFILICLQLNIQILIKSSSNLYLLFQLHSFKLSSDGKYIEFNVK